MHRDPTEVLFLDHASVLVKSRGRFLMTDPWHQKPAFGSWLPTFPQFVHPAYLSALGPALSILISHGHDDHCDDDLLAIFDKSTEIVTAKYSSPSVVARLKKIGFENIIEAGPEGKRLVNGFIVKSYINPLRSSDDAVFTIDTGDALIIHTNDNWFEFNEQMKDSIGSDRSRYDDRNVILMSQTNSASGFPLNYRGYTSKEKQTILRAKVRGMVLQGLRNAAHLNLSRLVSYAGYASVFVKDHPEYRDLAILPTAEAIHDGLLCDAEGQEILGRVKVLDFVPGDVLDLDTGAVKKSFISASPAAVKNAAHKYYEHYKIVEKCDTFVSAENLFDERRLLYFLHEFDAFAVRKATSEEGIFDQILGKVFEVYLTDTGARYSLKFGEGLVELGDGQNPNKRLTTTSSLVAQITSGKILFENSYTGYEAEWERFPAEIYNRDIVLLIVMFSYVFRNRLASKFNNEQ